MRTLEVQEVRISRSGEDKEFLATHKGCHSASDRVIFEGLACLRVALQDHWLPESSKFRILRHDDPLNSALFRNRCHHFHVQTLYLVLLIFSIEEITLTKKHLSYLSLKIVLY